MICPALQEIFAAEGQNPLFFTILSKKKSQKTPPLYLLTDCQDIAALIFSGRKGSGPGFKTRPVSGRRR